MSPKHRKPRPTPSLPSRIKRNMSRLINRFIGNAYRVIDLRLSIDLNLLPSIRISVLFEIFISLYLENIST